MKQTATFQQIEAEVKRRYEEDNFAELSYDVLSDDEKAEYYNSILDGVMRDFEKKYILCEATRAIYNTEETIRLLESIGFVVEDGDSHNGNAIGRSIYASLSASYNAAVSCILEPAEMANDEICDRINDTIPTIIENMRNAQDLTDEFIIEQYIQCYPVCTKFKSL